MSRGPRWILLGGPFAGLLVQAQHFVFAGVGLQSDFRTVAARYPHSVPQGEYLALAPEDAHDHISATPR
jgi:hypothetical protein